MLGNTLKFYREKNGLTQSLLAEKADINEKYYGRLERNECDPTVKMLMKICQAFGIRLSDFFVSHEKEEGL
ncbi:MAG: helix-turn-helix transcriptional regulator [Pelistega sp.]|nr:helix-turn-helix transcriptional regulator [Pelistega sp.]